MALNRRDDIEPIHQKVGAPMGRELGVDSNVNALNVNPISHVELDRRIGLMCEQSRITREQADAQVPKAEQKKPVAPAARQSALSDLMEEIARRILG